MVLISRLSVGRDTIECYIRNDITGKLISFTHVPDEVTDSMSASFDDQNIRGRSAPVKGYNFSGPRSVSVTVQLSDDYCTTSATQVANDIMALTHPNYDGQVVPPKCYLRIGQVKIKGVVTNVSVVWKKPYRDGAYTNADVSISVDEAVDIPFSASEVEGGRVRYAIWSDQR